MVTERKAKLLRRHLRVRKKIHGTAARPRLCIYKSLRHLYAQLVDDEAHRTLAFVTTNRKAVKQETADRHSYSNVAWAKRLGAEIGEKAKQAGIREVVFDRGGYPYHGTVKTFADAAREAGLQF